MKLEKTDVNLYQLTANIKRKSILNVFKKIKKMRVETRKFKWKADTCMYQCNKTLSLWMKVKLP